MTASPWPQLSWTVSAQRVPWLLERIKEMTLRARAFELALEQASSEGQAALSKVVSALEKWDKVVANVWLYAGLDARQIVADEVPTHAEELAKIWKGLAKYRGRILKGLGEDAAAKLCAHERNVAVTEESLRDRVGELPPMGMEVSQLGVVTGPPAREELHAKPVTPEEMRSRSAAETRELPDPLTVESILAQLPVPWVHTVFETLGLNLEEADEDVKNAGARAAAQRLYIHQSLSSRDFLFNFLFSLEEEERSLLADLVSAPEGMRYNEVTGRFGRDEADGFYWSERPPSGPLARLRRGGLAYVGVRRNRATVAVPEDLRPTILEFLENMERADAEG